MLMTRYALLVWTLGAGSLLLSCGDSNAEPTVVAAAPLCAIPLTADLAAPDWVRERTGVASYRYRAPIETPQVEVDLLDSSGDMVGTLSAEQLYDDATQADGALRAVLRQAGQPDTVLVTNGVVLENAYRVVAQLERESTRLEVHSTFALSPCFDGVEAAPSCGGSLPLSDAAYTLPSCGLLFDDALRASQAPQLSELGYRAPEKQRALDVLLDGKLTPVLEVDSWAKDAQVDSLLGSDAERILSTVFSDRSWWREVERHVSHCLGEEPATAAGAGSGTTTLEGFGSIQQPLCKGSAAKPASKDWVKPSSGNASKQAGFWGDPHMISLDGDAFNFQGAGEYVLLRSDADPALEVQARFEPMDTSSPLLACKNISVGTAVAVRAGAQRLSIVSRPAFAVRLDGEPLSVGAGVSLADGAEVVISSKVVTLDWPDGQHLRANLSSQSGRLELRLPASRMNAVRGLLGQFDGDPENDRVTASGDVLLPPVEFDLLYNKFGESWRVTDANSLFDYATGEDASTYVKANFPSALATLDDIPLAERKQALAVCVAEGILDPAHQLDCVLDAICLGETAAADAARVASSRSSTLSGPAAVWAEGDLRTALLPETIDLATLPAPDRCVASEPPLMRVFSESSVTLSTPLIIDGAGPGVVDSSKTPTPLAGGTKVRSFLLARRAGELSRPLVGRVRFATPVLGVIIADGSLSDATTQLAAAGVSYSSGPQGLEPGQDRVELSADGRTVTLNISGSDADLLRIITEAP